MTDGTGAVVPDAHLTLLHNHEKLSEGSSDAAGAYMFPELRGGSYDLEVDASGFAKYSVTDIAIDEGTARRIDVHLRVASEEQVTVTTETSGVSLNSEENTNTTVIKGSQLDALADDPDALQTELQSLAGPAAGPDGGQLYIDGYTGGQLPPKSSILEVRVNQNPFSAENDRIGYGRIDIITKPGAVKFGGHLRGSYLNSALNTSNPLATVQPSYQYYSVAGDVAGAITKNSSYFFAMQYWQRQNQNFLRAVDPNDTSAIPQTLSQAIPAPYSTTQSYGRFDDQLGKHILQAQWVLFRTRRTGAGTGGLNLPEQAYSSTDLENMLQAKDTVALSARMLNELSARWWRIRTDQTPESTRPAVTVQGSFVSGGSASGHTSNHQDNVELHDYVTLTAGKHVMRAGVLLRSYRVADYSNAGSNGNYQFQSLADYHAATPSPYLYTATVITNPLARLLQLDGALFFQDEWRWKPSLNVSYGLRMEGQNRVHDHINWAPRLAIAWSPGATGKTAPKTVLRAAGGVFYTRVTQAMQIQTIHNDGILQQNYVVRNPSFYDPNQPVPAELLESAPASQRSIYTLDPSFRISRNVQAAVGVDRSLGKLGSVNVNYLYTRGVHQYYTNNVNAPFFDPATYTISGTAPSTYNYQFQSGGDFRQHQLIVTSDTTYRRLFLHAVYTYNHATADTQGVNYFPSVARIPSLDYGRASFAPAHQLQAMMTYKGPFRINLTAITSVETGRPYNITIGNDLTGNNQSNARPTYGLCGAADVIRTSYGCLDINPTGKGERIVPYGLGTSPTSATVHVTLNRVFNFGERPSGGPVKPGAAPKPVPRYTLTVIAGATNILNMVNLAPPNGVLSSPLFGQQLAPPTGAFALSSPGNRTVYFTSYFSF
ncbi:MAG: carboxypeptidase regulatory-like domain-containing protein [Edaphobacter sp.]|uniref:TonB-dependent receptor n=1 Tax=Edaphobacter sp. TaxID=1934404 RepID=UPI002385A377|nr:carboxypeptidase regulatory-like domain-containing protein [Edaphobacter sp.]MDE1176017.1 carboxypeptidase regulatory-like domain-containing protein [Edaphobacter sp.]